MTTEERKSRQGIQSVEIGLRVLDVLAAFDAPQALGAIAAAAEMSSPQTHRYLASLIASGMARQDPGSGRYDLGPGALRLGLGALRRVDAFHEADVAMTAFTRETGRTVQIAALGPGGPVIVRWVMGFPPVATSMAVGTGLPLLRSATGHVFLAFRPENHTRQIVQSEQKGARGAKLAPVDVAAIRAQVRADGFSSVSGTVIPGLRATAVPIFDVQEEAVLTATVLATSAFPAEDDEAIRLALSQACDAVSQKIGGRRPAV